MEAKPQGFFGYSSTPASSGDAIETAVREINDLGEVNILTWRNLARGGSLVIDDILRCIERCSFTCFDLTGMNDNVLFEIGFAIARKKPVWLIFDTTIEESYRKWEQLGLLKEITYCSYQNNKDIVEKFLSEKPHRSAEILTRLLDMYVERETTPNVLLYLKQQVATTASGVVDIIIKERQVPTIVDDPTESKVQNLSWYMQNVSNSVAVLAELSSQDRSGHVLQNMKCSFISGLAKGLNKALYMLAEQPYKSPSDYRDLVNTYSQVYKIEKGFRAFLNDVKTDALNVLAAPKSSNHVFRKKTELQSVALGQWIAEHEKEKLYEYYVETKHISNLIKNEHNIIVGRKGCGKTASFFYLNDYFSDDVRNIMCVIKPNNFQIDSLLFLLRQARESYQIHYLVESSWKFLIYTEIARAFFEKVSLKPLYARTAREEEFLHYITGNSEIFLSDFSTRLENKLAGLQKGFESVLGSTKQEFLEKVSEYLHDTILYTIRGFIADLAPKHGRIVVLIDNLDKSWKVNSDLALLSEWVLGLLSVSGRISGELSFIKQKGVSVAFSLTIFLRTDIMKRVLQSSREPDKIEKTELIYDDKEILFRIINERYEVLNKDSAKEHDFWQSYVVSHVEEEDVKYFIFDRIFPRPRDLLKFISHAKDTAVARGHSKIEEADLKKAHELYSDWVLSSLFVENGITQEQMEDFIYQLAGNSQIISEEAVTTAMELTGIDSTTPENINYFVDHLVALSILGREVAENSFVFEYDLNVNKRNKTVASRANVRRFKIHSALIPALQLVD